MTEAEFAIHLAILSLAVWRLSSLLATEDGPLQVFERIRVRVGIRYDAHSRPYYPDWMVVAQELNFTQKQIDRPWDFPAVLPVYLWWNFGRGLCCLWCNSVWLSLAVVPAYFVWPYLVAGVLLPLAVAAVVVLIEGAARR